MTGIADVLLISPLIVLFITSLIPLTIKVLRGNQEQPAIATLVQALGGTLTSAVLLLVLAGYGSAAFSNTLFFDGISKWVGALALIITAGALILLYENASTKGDQFSEQIFLTLNSAIGMLVLLSAVDLLTVFIGLEMMSLSLYMMIAISHEQKLSKEASIKYFVLGGVSSAIFLYGMAMVFGTTGSTFLPEVMEKMPTLASTNKLFLLGIILMLLGFCFKVSIFPFHAWTPDVYQGAPTPITAYMSTAVKAVSFAAFIRLMKTNVLLESENILDILQWLAVLSMIVGNTAAILQNNFKRMLAYSSVAHSGYLLVGLITVGITENYASAVSSVIFYLVGYALMNFGALAVITYFEKTENTQVMVDDLGGLAHRRPLVALCLALFLLSLAGIPPTIGFFGKFYLFSAAVGEGLIWLAIWGMLNSVISVYYYLRPIVVMYMKEGQPQEVDGRIYFTKTAVAISAFLVLILGLISGPLIILFERSFS
jgi:NADH-quinone oxidoreductase subunit N